MCSILIPFSENIFPLEKKIIAPYYEIIFFKPS